MLVHALGSGTALIGVSAALAGLLGILLLLRQLWQPGGGTRSLGPSIPLTAQHALHVVDLGGRKILVGTGPEGAPALLTELSPPEAAAAAAATAAEASPDKAPLSGLHLPLLRPDSRG